MNTGSSVSFAIYRLTATVWQRLVAEHQHYYHFTLDCYRLASIKKRGLDPWYEGDESGYARRHREPGKAIGGRSRS